MRDIINSISGEYTRNKLLAEGALAQLTDDQVVASVPGGGNSVATICWHLAGNLRSRFTDFLTTDGEKPWRRREEEFLPRIVPREELLRHWESGSEAFNAAPCVQRPAEHAAWLRRPSLP